VFSGAVDNAINPLDGFKQHLQSIKSPARINFAEGCKLWSNDESQIAAAVQAAKSSDVAIVMVSTQTSHHSLPK
jgi:beta-glucosidase